MDVNGRPRAGRGGSQARERTAITVEIGELVLHGFPAARRHAIGDAVARELERLLATGGALAERSADHVRTADVRIDVRDAERTGRRIARTVHAALARDAADAAEVSS